MHRIVNCATQAASLGDLVNSEPMSEIIHRITVRGGEGRQLSLVMSCKAHVIHHVIYHVRLHVIGQVIMHVIDHVKPV
jgi:hypothetical protein